MLALAFAIAGCSKKEEKAAPSVATPPEVQVTRPAARTITRVVGQPSFVQSYERTSIYAKLPSYIEKWHVDIGDVVKKGDVLADLFMPELVEEWDSRKATVVLDTEKVRVAEKDVEVADAQVKAAAAKLDEAKAMLAKFEAEVIRWDVQVKRIQGEVDRQVIAPQILLESQNQFRSAVASRDAAKATIQTASADLSSSDASLARAKVGVAAAKADLMVAKSEAKRLEALVGYLKLTAPFDGIIVVRNANTMDFVLPQTGDPSAGSRSPDLSPSTQAAPVYVVDRTDVVRIFVDVPERDANFVHVGSKARVKLWAYKDEWLPASVTRLSWALNVKSRTMRAEIDIPNPGTKILPGMYAYGRIVIERPGVMSIPSSALVSAGGKTFVWLYDGKRAHRTEVQTGVEDGRWTEVTNLRADTSSDDPFAEEWRPIDGTEQVLTGSSLPILEEGGEVKVTEASPKNGAPKEEEKGKDAPTAASQPADAGPLSTSALPR
ncbi:efflux RND transporter periplasmic adaptor subunit [Aquisphaera insulae]|uniref:efflux RND transporter periplasmic adaptor subunit n=1 Tax=Aquisphaera insulae TaxID=2712864 RepID=UPI0013EDDDB0|nr:efflux RND transporter periplasmic adaptor subunit [Aquisphaera insulae]